MSLGKRLRTAREARGLTQTQLAKQCGIVQTAISLYELDKNIPGAIQLFKLADELQVEARWILFGPQRKKRR